MKVINVDKYDIIISKNLLENSVDYIEKVLPSSKHKKCVIITDKKVNNLGYSDMVLNSLSQSYACEKIVLPVGEKTKSFSTFQKTAEAILNSGFSRNCFLVALGGGVIGDLTGFLASTLLRGVPFVQMPTTLLAQVDSSIGGKTAINSTSGKNLIGSFYQPSLVLIDTNTLDTLDIRNLKAGYTEAFKSGLIGDEEFFSYCEKYGKSAILGRNHKNLEYIIEKSCKFKANIVKKDPFETKDIRVLLNLGHSFAHVYEKLVNFNSKKILHGEAVNLGIIQAFLLSKELELLKQKDVDRVINHTKELELFDTNSLKKLKEYQAIENFDEYMLANMKKDKKSDRNQYNLVLNKKIGESIFVRNLDLDKLSNFLKKI